MLPEVTVEWLPILVATIANMVLGFIWYMPGVFGNSWMMLLGKKKEDMKTTATPFVVMFILSLLVGYILTHFLSYVNADTFGEALTLGFWVSLGFVLAPTAANNIFAGRSWKLWAIDFIYQSVGIMLMAVIITLM